MKNEKKPQIRFKGFDDDWKQRKLGNIADKAVDNRGKTPPISEEGTHPLLEVASLGRVTPDYSKITKYLSNETFKTELRAYIKEGDILFSTVGSIGLVSLMDANENAAIAQNIVAFRANENYDSKFLYAMLSTEENQYKAQRIVMGAVQPSIKVSQLIEVEYCVTENIEEQRKLGEYFFNLDNLITLHQREQITTIYKENRRKSMNGFNKESEFEEALIAALQSNGWEKRIIKNPTEEQLIQNWADILFENNREIDRLNDCPLVREEMDELIDQIKKLRTPLALNGFINGKTVSITRKNPDDTLHYGKEISLKIYDRMEIAAGQSRYQIVEQPIFKRREKVLQDRRGDIMLLINGMPVFHIELKKTGVPVSEATNQIMKYAHEGAFTGLFSLVQIFFAMNPEETLYFANPGPDGNFNPDFFFHWADFNNEPINDWRVIASTILSIPLAHQLVGFYTVADDSDGVL